jgi:hypothetical protein
MNWSGMGTPPRMPRYWSTRRALTFLALYAVALWELVKLVRWAMLQLYPPY